jgi:hypothetical protein
VRGEVIDHVVTINTRGPFSAASYHAEALAPEDLTVVGARLQLTTQHVDSGSGKPIGLVTRENVAEDRSTPLVHLYANGRLPSAPRSDDSEPIQTQVTAQIRLRLRVRAGVVTPVVVVAAAVAGAMLFGALAHFEHLRIISDITAPLLIALPAVYAAFLLPQGGALFRRLFTAFRGMLVILTIVPYAAAGTLAIDIPSTARYLLWAAFGLVAAACLVISLMALRKALRVTFNSKLEDASRA